MGNKICTSCTHDTNTEDDPSDPQIDELLANIQPQNLTEVMIYDAFPEDVITRQPSGLSFMTSIKNLATCNNLK